MDLLEYEAGRFIDYKYMILDQINFNEDINYKLSTVDKDVDIFKNFIFIDLEYKNILYIYNFHDIVFYEIRFKYNICSYIMINNILFISLTDDNKIIRLILKIEKGTLYINTDKLNNLPFILNLEQSFSIAFKSGNYKEARYIDQELDEINRDINDYEKLIFEQKKINFDGFTVIDDTYQFDINGSLIKSKDTISDLKDQILDCRNLNKKELLITLKSKKNIVKYYIFTKETHEYIKFENITDVIEHIQYDYMILDESLVYEKST